MRGRGAATERTPRGPGAPAWRGHINRRGAQRHLRTLPSGTGGSRCLAVILAACQAGLGQEGFTESCIASSLLPRRMLI